MMAMAILMHGIPAGKNPGEGKLLREFMEWMWDDKKGRRSTCLQVLLSVTVQYSTAQL